MDATVLGVVAHRTIHEQVYQAMYQAILQGKLEPGARLNETALSAAFGVSRGPIREAIRRLESEGLLLTRAHRDTHVISLSGPDVVELYSVRAVLEGYAAVSALPALRAEHLPVMQRELDDLDRAARAQDWDRVAVLDAEWHSHITAAAANRRLTALWRNSNGPLRVLFARLAGKVYRPEQVWQRHQALYEVLRTGEPWAIEDAIREHYLASAHRLAARLDEGSGQPERSRKEDSKRQHTDLTLLKPASGPDGEIDHQDSASHE
jgi:DNA-binding GntR family transcriptional regulator